ncbi:MAG: hypothetical protein HS111_25770 [Kofleriaceae bacterium]|nr:hypothetical protein [Kofleriaceae bacterium]
MATFEPALAGSQRSGMLPLPLMAARVMSRVQVVPLWHRPLPKANENDGSPRDRRS